MALIGLSLRDSLLVLDASLSQGGFWMQAESASSPRPQTRPRTRQACLAHEKPPLLLHFPAVSPEKLGQHFLTDASWQERIARAIRIDNGVWVEIGAGHGEMTTRLARHAAKVLAIELDPRLAARLRERTAPLGNVEVIESDVLAVDFARLASGAKFSVYGNLPYYITSPILHRLFEHADRIGAIHVVMQFEVALRIVAPPGRRDYGYLSVLSQWFSRPELVLRIPPGAFRPRPKVASALVSLHMPGARVTSHVDDEKAFLEFVKECFAQKRKTLRNNLRARLGSRTEEILREGGLSPGARAEELSVSQFAALFQLLA
jgi:16S rRNA (adenine1518-N6/adenine1519-N6)-dimethyltransferase